MVEDEEFPGTERFRVLKRLGSGGLGLVYEVHDRERDQRVALKTLRAHDSQSLYLLKREFRALADIAHPNLIHLYDLVVDGDLCFFTMELIEGVDFLRWCAAEPQRTSEALAQLARGLHALHGAGKLHRDIKANNILVAADGRLVLLDLGLAADLRRMADDSLAGRVVGTVAYMSPEQTRAEPELTPAADWYSVGVLLYHALTGRLPFLGSVAEVMRKKRSELPPHPRELAASADPELADLCLRLLAIEPAERADGAEVLATLGIATEDMPSSVATTPSQPGESTFAGREATLTELDRAAANLPAVAVISGPSGIGKTALVRELLRRRRLSGEDQLVLEGRCYERENIPYKALDGLVDQLSHYWRQLDDAEAAYLLPRDAELLPRLFPVLARVPVVAAAPRTAITSDPLELRRRAFAALGETLQRLATRRRVTLFLDDLQWVDRDTVTLLIDLFTPAHAPALLLVLCTRQPLGEGPLGRLLGDLGDAAHRFALDPLSQEDAAAVADTLLGGDAELAARIAREADGSPLFVCELARHAMVAQRGAPTTLDDMIAERVGQLADSTRTVLDVVAVMGEPIPAAVLTSAASLDSEAGSRELRTLRSQRLVRRASGADEDRFVAYHDRIRAAVLQAMSPTRRVRRHRALAIALEEHASASSELLARHWLAAGEGLKATDYARRAADAAVETFAFDQAARLYRLCIEHRDPRGEARFELLERLAGALANAGRGPESAEAFRQAAELAHEERGLDLRRLAAEQLLKSGHIDEGLDMLRTVLSAFGISLSRTPRRAAMQLVYQRLRLRLRGLRFTERNPAQIPARALTRSDVCNSVSQGLSMVDNILAAQFQVRHLMMSLSVGEPQRIATALAAEAVFRSSVSRRGQKRGAPLLARAAEIARRIEDPKTSGLVAMCRGLTGVLCGEWASAIDECTAAEAALRDHCDDIQWELDTTRVFMLWGLFFRGELTKMRTRVAEHLREASERGDLYMVAALQTGARQYLLLADDDADESERVARKAMQGWSQRGFHIQHYYELLADVHRAMYRGDGVSAWQQIRARWNEMRDSFLLRVQFCRINALGFRGRAAVAAGELEDALRAAARLDREGRTWARAFAAVIRAGVALRREGDDSTLLLERAEKLSSEADMGFQTAYLRWVRGRKVGGDAGSALVSRAEEWFRDSGIVNPERYAQVIVPGSS